MMVFFKRKVKEALLIKHFNQDSDLAVSFIYKYK